MNDDLRKVADEISSRFKYMRGDKGKLEDKYQNLKQWQPGERGGKVARVAGLAGIDLAWFLFCLGKFGLKDLNKIFLDNRVIDKFKKENEQIITKDSDPAFNKFFDELKKSHPQAAATLHLWMLYALISFYIAGGVKIFKGKDNENNKTTTEQDDDFIQEEEINQEKQHSFASYQENLQSITPWLISELISAEGVHMENGMHTPYKDGNGIWTIGFGSTRLKDGSHVTANTPPITTEEAYELARWHLEEHETYFDLYCYSVADEKLKVRNTGEAFGLSSIVYNSGTKFIEAENDKNHRERFTLLREEYKKYGAAIPDSVVSRLFAEYPIVNKASFGKTWIDSGKPEDMAKAIGLYMADGNGMHWRRWLEAGLITGDIEPEDLLECPIKGMYDFYMYMGGYKEYKGSKKESKKLIKQKDKELKKSALWEKTADGWIPKKSTYRDFKKWLKNPKTKQAGTGIESEISRQKVKDFLPSQILQECMNGKCEIGIVSKQMKQKKDIEEKTYTIGYEDFYQIAMDNYNRGDYNGALIVLEEMVKDNPDNALLHNDMALIYNKMGEYDKAIEQVRIIVYEIGDKSQYGAAQYNAGMAYEKKGDVEQALKNYKLSLVNGNTAAREAIKRLTKKQNNTKSKKTAFGEGIKKIKAKQKNNIVYTKNNSYMT